MKTLVVRGTHGDEMVDINVPLGCASITGNPRAVDANERYIDVDLNRVFGEEGETYEHRRARDILPIIRNHDVVVDVHTTTSGNTDACIVIRDTDVTRAMGKRMAKNYVVFPQMTKSLIAQAKHGIAVELAGKDDPRYRDILSRDDDVPDWQAWEVVGSVQKKHKAGTLLYKNYDFVPKCTPLFIADDGEMQYSQFDFYPFLWGQHTYDDIWGFALRKKMV